MLWTLKLFLLFFLAVLAFSDIKTLNLPTHGLWGVGVLSLLLKGLEVSFLSLYAIFTLWGLTLGLKKVYRLKRGREGLGWGDVKFFSLAGFWVSLDQIPLFLVCVGAIGCAAGIVWRRMGRGEAFPLGAVIAAVLSGWIWTEG